MRPAAVALHKSSASIAHVTHHDSPTLVLRSTHSSQLNVGLLRFCFFFDGRPSPCVALLEGSGLMEDCTSSSIARKRARGPRFWSGRASGPIDAMTGRLVWHGCHAKASCNVTGISEVGVVSRCTKTVRGSFAEVRSSHRLFTRGLDTSTSFAMACVTSTFSTGDSIRAVHLLPLL
jgi:hypothetical protein